jgi:hypothetical protein
VASHLGALGFPAATREEFEALGLLAASLGEALDAPTGGDGPAVRYVRWSAGAGIELWAQADATARAVRGLTPYFASGRASLDARVVSVVADPKRAADGKLLVVPGAEGRREALAPVAVASPDFGLVRAELAPGSDVSLSVAAFAHALFVFPDARELVRASPEGLAPGLVLAAPQGGLALAAGIVLASEERTNPQTRRPFGWWLVEVSGGTIDVLVDPELEKPLPTAGEAVRGVFWLCARIRAR